MCTKSLLEVKGPKTGWKVVRIYDNGDISSLYKHSYMWEPNTKHIPIRPQYKDDIMDDKVFHCFARRSDVRRFKKDKDKSIKLYYRNSGPLGYIYKIIKVTLTGKVYSGMTGGIDPFNNLPATCGTEAYWDGKFHR